MKYLLLFSLVYTAYSQQKTFSVKENKMDEIQAKLGKLREETPQLKRKDTERENKIQKQNQGIAVKGRLLPRNGNEPKRDDGGQFKNKQPQLSSNSKEFSKLSQFKETNKRAERREDQNKSNKAPTYYKKVKPQKAQVMARRDRNQDQHRRKDFRRRNLHRTLDGGLLKPPPPPR